MFSNPTAASIPTNAFLSFWRQHAEPLLGSDPYHEIASHLVLMAFLHRVVNACGTIDREYAIGWGRMDLCVRYASAILGIELKAWRDGEADPIHEGLKRIDGYLQGIDQGSGWLVIFDRRNGQPRVCERTGVETGVTASDKRVAVILCLRSLILDEICKVYAAYHNL